MKKILLISLLMSFFLIEAFCGDILHKAAYNGDMELVKKILKTKVNPDERDSFGGTALHAAMFQKNIEIIILLIDNGFDVNAIGTSNGYTPLHDAVWANNLEAVKILVSSGAKTDIKGKDGLTPYEKAVKDGKKEIINFFDSKSYDKNAKTMYSENDVKAFVYNWFSGFDHQSDISFFKKHLDPQKVDMYFPDFPIKSIKDFEKWYNGVINNIQWNTHIISNLKVTGDETRMFFVSFDVNWKAKAYNGENYNMNIHQDWNLKIDKERNFIIEKHKATVIDK
ncbi:MAG: hypothetical protein A2086_07505 [Spirochaetes bacterium GWD1_27_9]|nr:MAG: hypothetical protein A2Z98_18150 [Spirochaetes bacterium GWB1_27_13]OHD27952.1 MAG: hypothetical protein A2Y34_13340 [Spirochaetes bacterium GWC1_27_15]OHD44778.1 MAG: hypothetical protein A2086_07505 [Spirochaetes bacterium GWD1_27_9]